MHSLGTWYSHSSRSLPFVVLLIDFHLHRQVDVPDVHTGMMTAAVVTPREVAATVIDATATDLVFALLHNVNFTAELAALRRALDGLAEIDPGEEV